MAKKSTVDGKITRVRGEITKMEIKQKIKNQGNLLSVKTTGL